MEQNPNVAIRLVEKDNVIKFALVDYVMAITCRSRHDSANLVCNSLKSAVNGEKAKKLLWDKHQFPGSGQREIYVVTIKEATSYLQCLPHKYTQDVLDYIENQFFRVTGGDPSLHEEIQNNSESNHPINQAARETVGLPIVVTDVIEPELKKRRLMIEMEEREFALKERIFALKEREVRMNREHVIETFNVIKDLSGGTFDSREQQLYKDIMLNSVMPRRQQMITNGDKDITKDSEMITTQDITNEITVSDTIIKLKYRIHKGVLTTIGKIMAKQWRDQNPGKEIPTVKKLVDGSIRDVKRYFEKDRPMLEQVIHDYYKSS